jgi:hypothetical protein
VNLPVRFACFLLLGVCFGLATSAEPIAADDAHAALPGVRQSLFNGENLDGWIVTGCEVAVEDGKLVLKDGDGFVRTHHRYGDFIFECQWRALRVEKWDSGIYFRAELPAEGKAWPARYQINLKQGAEGVGIGLPQAKTEGLVKVGDWNHFKLTVIGGTATLEINGQPAWKVDGVEGPSGYIGLQSEVAGGGQFEFKNLAITELGYRSLFNGQDLTGWEGGGSEATKCWKVEDGLLVCTGEKGPWLRSQETFGDFNLRLKYKLKPAGNSGVYIRVPPSGNHHGAAAGIEVQLLDDAAPRYKDLKPYQYTGSLYAIVAAEPRVGREPGQWNTLEINCRDRAYRVTHNGIVVLDADDERCPELKQRLVEGHLGLQNHSEEVWFHQLRIGPAQ